MIGFTVHNITEGIGIAAPMLPRLGTAGTSGFAQPEAAGPRLTTFAGLALLAGSPAILGAWMGGFAFSPLLTVLFLGVGTGAIWQVMFEVGELLRAYARSKSEGVITWINVGGFLAGVLTMYLTAFLVSF